MKINVVHVPAWFAWFLDSSRAARLRLGLLRLPALALCAAFQVSGGFAAGVIQFSAPSYAGIEGFPEMAIIVARSGDLDTVVSVDLETKDGSATASADYLALSTKLTFQAGETRKIVAIPILNDGLVEANETFQTLLANPGGGAVLGARVSATGRITDNDKGLQLELAEYSVNEDRGAFTIRVLRLDDGDFPVSIDYATAALTAVPGEDYTGVSGNLAFAPGEAVKRITVPLLNDAVPETAQTFTLTLNNPSGGVVLGAIRSSTVSITDTDNVVQFQSAAITNREDAAFVRLAVERGESAVASTVEFATADAAALSGQDYKGTTNVLQFAAGERRKFIDVPLLNDGLKELLEKFRAALRDPASGAVLGPVANVAVSILDNDPGVGFEQNAYPIWENQGAVVINVLRGGDEQFAPFAVDYRTVDGTARAGIDYEAVSGTLAFKANETLRSVIIPLRHDPAAESAKSFTVSLGNPTAGMPLGTSSTRITISDAGPGRIFPVEPPASSRPGIRREMDQTVVSWEGSAVVRRADHVAGPWETPAGTRSPHAERPSLPERFYQIRSARPTRLYVPASYDGQTPLPLILVLHGYSGDAAWMENYYRFRSLAESRGFLLCYPEGTTDLAGLRFWNATDACCDFDGLGVDDSAYLRDVIAEIMREFTVDRKRIHVAGLSNGGVMTHRMASDHAGLIAAIASQAGATFIDPASHHPSQPVNVLHIHGTADETAPYGGGSFNLAQFPGALKTVEIWAALNGSKGLEAGITPVLDLVTDLPGLDSTVLRYTNSPPGGAVELWTINGGIHVPNLTPQFHEKVVDWLLAHPKP